MARLWYAALKDSYDTDWGYGSFDLEEAKQMAKAMENPDAHIAVIKDNDDPICIEVIYQNEFEWVYQDDLEEIFRNDLEPEW